MIYTNIARGKEIAAIQPQVSVLILDMAIDSTQVDVDRDPSPSAATLLTRTPRQHKILRAACSTATTRNYFISKFVVVSDVSLDFLHRSQSEALY